MDENEQASRPGEFFSSLLWVALGLAVLSLLSCNSRRPAAKLVETETHLLEHAFTPMARPALIPRPKERTEHSGAGLQVDSSLTVHCPDDEIAAHLGQLLGPQARLVAAESEASIVLEISPELAPPHPQSYQLQIENGKARLHGGDRAGLYYALQTLAWLRQPHGWDPVLIRDWPSFPDRGVLLHTGADSGPTHRKLVERVLAPLKFNTLVLECEYARWESHPELWSQELSVPKEQLRQTVEFARRHQIEPIPLIQTLSHMGWLFVNKQNLEYGVYSLNYSFPPQEKLLWKIVFDIYEEAIEVFEPRRFHIGFDEVRSLKGIFPGTKREVEDVIVEQATRLQTWLDERGIATIMWADMLLHRSEAPAVGLAPSPEAAASVRQRLPKSITVVDWQYEVDPLEFPELTTLVEAGFPTMVAPWNHGPTTLAQAAALKERGGLGVLQTTWPGRVLNDKVVEGAQYHQFASFVTAAEAAWNGGGDPPPDEGRTFAWLWGKRAQVGQPQPGFALTFQGSVQQPSLPPEPTLMGEVTFLSRGGLRLDQDRQFPLEHKASELAFLWVANSEAPPGETVAHLEIEFAEGRVEQVPVRIHKEISWLEDPRPVMRAPVCWESEQGVLRCWRWPNPSPQETIKSVTVRTIPDRPEITLYGLTAVETGITNPTH